ncbi:hypothetical protein JGH11_04565 [Dysgonomonas sp. Marseille-P4677]|uniref:hypothetical protein n=1 Tax=Dysgonomonas sp. Marseille-P4677 TaxID=2364790 RepID=UPI001A4FF31D|nr:hypothetical protein [Dysgonomonas sp. Marseille-P4677]MBK5720140.1 hypothetical protein [Dysgonomonas sp. Marseille-P4677]
MDESQTEYSYILPGEWDELTAGQLLFLIGLVNKNISAEEIKLKMFLFCLKARIGKRNTDDSFRLKVGKNYFDLSADELYAISEIFDFLFLETEDGIRINPLLVKNPFPVIRIGWVRLYGPADGLTDYTYQQFMELQIAQADAAGSEKKVNEFISSLYRRKKGKPSQLSFLIPNKKKTAIVWFYMGCMAFIQERFPLVFSGVGSSDLADGQMRIVDALAKNDVTKKKEVRNADLYEALYTMQIAAEESEKLRKKE